MANTLLDNVPMSQGIFAWPILQLIQEWARCRNPILFSSIIL